MVNIAAILQSVAVWVKTHGPTVTAIASGVGLIIAQQYGPGFTEILQALLVLAAGTSVVQLHTAVRRLSADFRQDVCRR